MICPNCSRDLTSRACGDPAHRVARGFLPVTVVGSKVGKSYCPECGRWLNNDHFWSRGRKVKTLKCGGCLRKRRMGRPTKLAKKARWRRELDDTNAYWEAQARAHP